MTLPIDLNALTSGMNQLQDFLAEAVIGGGNYIKMNARSGEWTIGTDALTLEQDSEWIVDPASFSTGYSAFDDNGQRVGEEMSLVMSEPPVDSKSLPKVNGAWERQIGFTVRCLNGEDKGEIGLINMRSKGGMSASATLLGKVVTLVQGGSETPVPVLHLGSSGYKHAKYGEIFNPVYDVARWVKSFEMVETEEVTPTLKAVENKPEPEAVADQPETPEPEPKREPEVIDVKPEPEPEPESAPVRRRRRRA